MSFSKPMGRSARLWLVLFLVIAAVTAVSAAPQHSALAATRATTGCSAPSPVSMRWGAEADNEPTYIISTSSTCHGVSIPDGHVCRVLGTDESQVQAIECTNVYIDTSPTGSEPSFQVYTAGTYYCQGTAIFQCAGMKVKDELGTKRQFEDGQGSGTVVYPSGTYTCGDKGGEACPNGGKASVAGTHMTVPYFSTPSLECAEVWPSDESGNIIQEADVNGLHSFTSTSGLGPSQHMNICVPSV